MSVQFGDIVANHPVHATVDANGTVHMAYWDEVDNDVIMLRLYPDADRDLVLDMIDAMPNVPDQWMNSDGDNYGDNPLGLFPMHVPLIQVCRRSSTKDVMITTPTVSRDDIDGCDDEGGTSWIDRFGCEDRDQDGWSDNLQGYLDGDEYYSNWKQSP